MDVTMKKEISAQEYNSLPRQMKRELNRSLKKQGKEAPEIRERVQMGVTVDKQLFNKGAVILEQNNIDVGRFLDLSFTTLINNSDQE